MKSIYDIVNESKKVDDIVITKNIQNEYAISLKSYFGANSETTKFLSKYFGDKVISIFKIENRNYRNDEVNSIYSDAISAISNLKPEDSIKLAYSTIKVYKIKSGYIGYRESIKMSDLERIFELYLPYGELLIEI